MINFHQLSLEFERLAEISKEISNFESMVERVRELFISFIASPHSYYETFHQKEYPFRLFARPLPWKQSAFDWPVKGPEEYQVAAVDGSQAGPYRVLGWYKHLHMINIASLQISYGSAPSFTYHVCPMFTGLEAESEKRLDTDDIAIHRSYHEFDKACQWINARHTLPSLLFIDGSLIWWSLDRKSDLLKEQCITLIQSFFSAAQSRQVIPLGYISGTQSSDLTHCLKAVYCSHATGGAPRNTCVQCSDPFCAFLSVLKDEYLFELWYNTCNDKVLISPLFQSVTHIGNIYDEVPVYFFYMYFDNECVRIELPFFCHQRMDWILQVLSDQISKGQGYPIALSDAHELAVVTERDKKQLELVLENYMKEHDLVMVERKKDTSKGTKYV